MLDLAGFTRLLDAWSPGMHRLAMAYVGDAATAQEVVQETWTAVIEDVAQLDGRSSLQNRVYRILLDVAQRRASRCRRVVMVDELTGDQDETLACSRFRPLGASFPGHWKEQPARWPAPQDATQAAEVQQVVADAVRRLPPYQAAVVTLRDIEGFDSAATSALLGLSMANQLRLLHRARAAVRAALEEYVDGRLDDPHLPDLEVGDRHAGQ